MMGGLILLVILVPVLILILLINILTRSGEQKRLMEALYDKIRDLDRKVSDLSMPLREKEQVNPAFETSVEKFAAPEKQVIEEKPPVQKVEEPVIVPEIIAEATAISRSFEQTVSSGTEKTGEFNSQGDISVNPKEKDTDLEKFIGENLANKIGIAVLVLGIGFFVKYAIDKNWIGEAGRVIIGLICGGILIGLAHRFRNTYRSFSSVLVGGGLSVFYFSIAFAFHQYHLIGQTPAFIFMVLVSAFAVLLSLFYNRQELAILATIGGFITPFLVSTGQDNYVALFVYLCILNAGLTALSWFKRWPAINIISLFFTTLIFGGWLLKRAWFTDEEAFPFKDAFFFASLFYLLFVGMNIINSLRLKNKFVAFDFIILLSVNFLYYVAGITILSYWNNGNADGAFTLSLGLFNLLLTLLFYKNKSADRNFVFLLLGLAITFISLAVPIQFNGHHIVLFWAAESVVLLALYQRTKIKLLKISSLLLLVLSIASLTINWAQLYFSGGELMPVLLNKAFLTAVIVVMGLFMYHVLLKKETEEQFFHTLDTVPVRNAVLTAGVILLYISGALEIHYQFSHRFKAAPVHIIFLQLYSFLFAWVLLQVNRRHPNIYWLKTALTAFCLVIYLFSIASNYEISLSLLTGNSGKGFFIAHWGSVILLLWMLISFARCIFLQVVEVWQDHKPLFTWVTITGIIILISIELYHVNVWSNYRNQTDWQWWENLYYKAGLSIVWSICSFILMWLGMKYNFRTLRIISLSLFTITLAKLFSYDIRNIPPGGKIAAFILLGVLLLVVSFMYQRLKKIIIDDVPAEKNKEYDHL